MEKRLALVTGAAGGIGAAVARALGERGIEVAAVDRDAAQLEEVVAKLGVDDLPVVGFAADVSDSAAVEALVGEVERRLGPIDYLVNAAGVLRLGEVSSFSD
ncbi:SDR family NAD(P)-dependent oxidoreductase, partial [Streptomyces sp. RY43-2]